MRRRSSGGSIVTGVVLDEPDVIGSTYHVALGLFLSSFGELLLCCQGRQGRGSSLLASTPQWHFRVVVESAGSQAGKAHMCCFARAAGDACSHRQLCLSGYYYSDCSHVIAWPSTAAGGLGRRGRPAAVEMVRPPTVAAAALARMQQTVGAAMAGLGLRGGAAGVPSPGPRPPAGDIP